MSLYLKKEFLSSWYTYIYRESKVYFISKIDKFQSIEDLNVIKDILNNIFRQLPEEEDITLYSAEPNIIFKDVNNPNEDLREKKIELSIVGGDQQIIKSSIIKKKWMSELLEKKIEEILAVPQELSVFGQWNDLVNPQFFILKNKYILSCLFTYFDKINRTEFALEDHVYDKLVRILYKTDGNPYSKGTFKKTKERYSNEINKNKEQKQICKNKNFSEASCVSFFNYILSYELKS